MNAAAVLSLSLVPALALGEAYEFREMTREDLDREVFPRERRLPERIPGGEGGDWIAEWRAALASERCGEWTIGDVVARAASARSEPARAADELELLLATCPEFAAGRGAALRELLLDGTLRGTDWDPARDRADDGILLGPRLDLDELGSEPWNSLRGSDSLFQAAVLVFADLEAVKEAENDYSRYPLHIGANYETIAPLDGYCRRLTDVDGTAAGDTALALRLRFRCDLPFPFGEYTCSLDVLNRLNGRGELVTDIWSDSRDFHWMAGSDVFLPVLRSDGEFVALLLVRRFGFDLRGVPEGDDHRREGLRCSLGNLKLEAERRFALHAGPPRTLRGALPAFDVRR